MLKIQLPEARTLDNLTMCNRPILKERNLELSRERVRIQRIKKSKRKYNRKIQAQRKRQKEKEERVRAKRHEFGNTPVGAILRNECPHEWQLLTALGNTPEPETIEAVSYASPNGVFRTERFRGALQDYWQYGTITPNAVKTDVNDELAAIRGKLTGQRGTVV